MTTQTRQAPKAYQFNKSNSIAKVSADEIEEFLYSLPNTVEVVNVEDDINYQKKDIDLLWRFRSKKTKKVVTKSIEIKGDTYYKTGNYFFETVSNTNKGTPGCFLYTESDWVFYYFVEQKELHILPTHETRDWFIGKQGEFKDAFTSTSSNGRVLYSTKGKKVPRSKVSREVNVHKLNISQYIQKAA